MKKTLLLILISFTLYTCGSDEIIETDVAPEIPPVTTFLMDFGITSANPGGRTLAQNNWNWSALNVGIWNSIITVALIVPVASFVESFHHEPTFDASLPGWVWEYDYNVLGVTHYAKLQGEISSSSVQWKMFITKSGVYENFNWYSGTSSLDGLSGIWTLNADPTDPKPFIRIDWNRALSGETANIKYTNITPESNDNGSFIFFEKGNNNEFDRQYDIFRKPQNNAAEIEWSSTNKNGRIKDPGHYGDSDYHCWDEALEDIDCPS